MAYERLRLEKRDWELIEVVRKDLDIEQELDFIEDEDVEIAHYDYENTISVNPNADEELLLHNIFHELRHVWQNDMAYKWGNPEFIRYFEEYKEIDEFDNIDDYNMQFLEVDAIAYSEIMTNILLYEGVEFASASSEVNEAIDDRIAEIIEERRRNRRYAYLIDVL